MVAAWRLYQLHAAIKISSLACLSPRDVVLDPHLLDEEVRIRMTARTKSCKHHDRPSCLNKVMSNLHELHEVGVCQTMASIVMLQ